jgi:uncharacterized protein
LAGETGKWEMKMRRDLAWALVLWFVVGHAVLAQTALSGRTIVVSGTVETKTAPDQIVWAIDLTDTDRDMRTAKTRNDEKVKAVIALREKLGVGEGDLETGAISIYRQYERDERTQRSEFKGFNVHRRVTIRQRDLKRFDDFLDALVASAEMEIHFNFESSRMREIRAETRLKALQAAKEKAAAMAAAVGAKLGPVVTIDESPVGDRWSGPNNNSVSDESGPAADLATDTFVPGAISVRVTVRATFELQ